MTKCATPSTIARATCAAVVAVLSALLDDGLASVDEVRDAMERHGIDPEAIDPLLA